MQKDGNCGPLLDRIDLHLEVPAVPFQELSATADGTTSESMREQVRKARGIQYERFAGTATGLNSRMTSKLIRKHCQLSREGKKLMQTAIEELGLSARAYDRVLRVSRTISDLEGSQEIREVHLVEGINYRSLDRKLWRR